MPVIHRSRIRVTQAGIMMPGLRRPPAEASARRPGPLTQSVGVTCRDGPQSAAAAAVLTALNFKLKIGPSRAPVRGESLRLPVSLVLTGSDPPADQAGTTMTQ